MKLMPRMQPVEAWRHDGSPQPNWAKLMHNDDGDLIIDRRSGRQRVNPGEWLVKSLDSAEVAWMTDDMVRRDYETVSG